MPGGRTPRLATCWTGAPMSSPPLPPAFERIARELEDDRGEPPNGTGGHTGGADVDSKKWPTVADHLLSMGPVRQRLATGFATLDTAVRGGIPGGKRIVLVG